MAAITPLTTTGTLAPGASDTFGLRPGSTLRLAFPPNSRATVTEVPLQTGQSDTSGKSDTRVTKIDGIAQTLVTGPYTTGGNVTVETASNSSASVTWTRVDTVAGADHAFIGIDPDTDQPYVLNDAGLAVALGGLKAKTVAPWKIWGAIQNSAGLLGVTNHATYEIPFDFFAVRCHVENMASTAQINRLASIAVSNDGTAAPYTPSGSFTPVTFSGTASHATTACTTGAGTNDAVPTDLVSDWITLQSIPRTDGGSGRILMYRETVPAAGNTTGNRVDIGSTSLSLDVCKVDCYYKSGDFVTTPAGFTSATEWTMAPAVWFEFLTADGVVTLLACGDSTVQGADGGPMPNVGGAARLAVAGSNRTGFVNEGWSSQQSTAYYPNALAKLTAVKPSIAFYCPWSPNDTDRYTDAGVLRMKRQALQWVDACRDVGATPVLLTPCPANGLTAPQEAYRRQIVEFVKVVCNGGAALLADRDAIYTDYSTSVGGFLPGLNSTPLHPSPTGYALEASRVWVPLMA